MLLTILVFILILAVLVLAHELGHFLVARRNGVAAEEFGFGFPPRLAGVYRDENNKLKIIWGNREVEESIRESEKTVYSINLIPLGGFVRIRGEDGESKGDPKSFASQSIWTRFKILSAGVVMNFLLGIVLLAFALQLGLPDVVGDDRRAVDDAKIQIIQVSPSSPASDVGIVLGDEILAVEKESKKQKVDSVEQFQEFTQKNAGEEVKLFIRHPGEEGPSEIIVSLRDDPAENQGSLGVALAKTATVKYGFFESFWKATKDVAALIWIIVEFVGILIWKLVTAKPVGEAVTGPVGIAVITGQMTQLGLAHILQFAAILSVNLGVINFLPFPALDGGRVIFLGIEKIKGAPVSQKVESYFHAAGFIILIGLMILITVRDFANFGITDKIKGWF